MARLVLSFLFLSVTVVMTFLFFVSVHQKPHVSYQFLYDNSRNRSSRHFDHDDDTIGFKVESVATISPATWNLTDDTLKPIHRPSNASAVGEQTVDFTRTEANQTTENGHFSAVNQTEKIPNELDSRPVDAFNKTVDTAQQDDLEPVQKEEKPSSNMFARIINSFG